MQSEFYTELREAEKPWFAQEMFALRCNWDERLPEAVAHPFKIWRVSLTNPQNLHVAWLDFTDSARAIRFKTLLTLRIRTLPKPYDPKLVRIFYLPAESTRWVR